MDFQTTVDIVRKVLDIPELTPGLLTASSLSETLDEYREVSARGRKRDEIKATVETGFTKEILEINATQMLAEWNRVSAQWFLPRYFGQKKIKKKCKLSQAMLAGSLSIEKIDSDYWLDKVEKMEKEGIDFVNVSKVDIHMKKKLGVFGGAGIMLILMLLVIGVLIYGYVVDADMPLWALTLVIVPIVAVIVGTIVAMVSRIKEIDKGEEDEAAKY